jgi:hypothetical protein
LQKNERFGPKENWQSISEGIVDGVVERRKERHELEAVPTSLIGVGVS